MTGTSSRVLANLKMLSTQTSRDSSPLSTVNTHWIVYAERFSLLRRLESRLQPDGWEPAACWKFLGAHSRGGRREVAYPSMRLGDRGLGTIRVNRLMLILSEVPTRVLALGTEADLLLHVLRINRQRRSVDAAHLCDARGGGAGCCAPTHLAWETHLHNVQSGVARKRQRDAQRSAAAYLAEIRL